MGPIAVGLRTAIYMAGFIFFFGWLALGVRQFDSRFSVDLPLLARPLGAAVMVLGGVLVLLCGGLFTTIGHGTPAVFDPPTQFVVRGPYRWVRNPMYIGGLVLLTGFGLWHRSLSILVMALVCAVALHLFVVLLEEPGLERRFGDQYNTYKQRVFRWVPKRPRNG